MNHPLDFVEDAIARRAIMDATDIVMGHRGSLDGFRHAIREAVNIGKERTADYAYAVKVAATIAELAKLDSDDVARIMMEENNR
tara:strand:+ start:123 stop:374 length:252 start_codon:yes stop_codon:yes gene_type:complete